MASGLFLLAVSSFDEPTPAQRIQKQFLTDIARFDSAAAQLETGVHNHQSAAVLQAAFLQTRDQYKHIEYLTESSYALIAKSLNGPPVPEGELDDGVGKQLEPHGLQVLEELLYPYDPTQDNDLLQEVIRLRETIAKLHRIAGLTPLSDSHIFDAMRLEIFRIISLGISGFDTPITHRAMPEAVITLSTLRQPLQLYLPSLRKINLALADSIEYNLTKAIAVVQANRRFADFDRLQFIKDHAYLLSRLFVHAQQGLSIPISTDRTRLLSASAATPSDPNAFDPGFFNNTLTSRPTEARVELGRQLFYEPLLSGNGQRTCATCHRADRAFTDGEPTSLALNGHGRIGRNAPTLLNAALQTAMFMDSRVFRLEDQVQDVLQNESEMGGSLTIAVQQLRKSNIYSDCFKEAYTDGVTDYNVANALASYVRSLTSLNSRIDQYLRGEPVQLTPDEKRGFNLFMGKANCGTCHYFPLFNGSIPPTYRKTESEVIGVPATLAERQLDADSGRYMNTKLAIHKGAFKIPTVRHVGQTAPYMHNGVYQTLEQVVEFYNKGGGNGLGFNLPNQTLPEGKLDLTRSEKRALVAFMKALE